MTLKNMHKMTTILTPEQLEAIKEISKMTRIAQSELFREAVDDLIRKYRGVVNDRFAKNVEKYMEKRNALMERLSR